MFLKCDATTDEGVLLCAADLSSDPFLPWLLALGGRGGGSGASCGVKLRPVILSQTSRIIADRQRIVRVTRAGRECHDKNVVPTNITTLRGVIIRNGEEQRVIQIGDTKRIRMKRVIKVGPMVAVVGDWPTDKKAARLEKGSVRTARRADNS